MSGGLSKKRNMAYRISAALIITFFVTLVVFSILFGVLILACGSGGGSKAMTL